MAACPPTHPAAGFRLLVFPELRPLVRLAAKKCVVGGTSFARLPVRFQAQRPPRGLIEEVSMRQFINHYRSGKIGYILLWLLGVPIPILLLIFLLRGCT